MQKNTDPYRDAAPKPPEPRTPFAWPKLPKLSLRTQAIGSMITSSLLCALGARLNGASSVDVGIGLLWTYGATLGIAGLVALVIALAIDQSGEK